MFSKKMLPSKPKLVMPHEGKSINRKVGLIRGQKNGATDKNHPRTPTKTSPLFRQKLPPDLTKTYPQSRQTRCAPTGSGALKYLKVSY